MSVDAVNELLAAPSKPEPVVQNGQYVIRGEKFTRATTFAATLDDRYSLERWQQRMVASGLVLRQDLHVAAAANLDDRDALNDLCEQAIEAAKGRAGANIGTALHALAEQVDRGETPVIPPPFDLDIAAYTATLDANGVRVDPALMEGVVVCRDLGVAGRFDRIVMLDGYPVPMIADLKTGSISHSLTTIAIQLAIYANADEVYDPATDELTPMPRVDTNQALIIHLPAGEATCTLYTVDIGLGWQAAQLCKNARQWRNTRNLAAPFESTQQRRVGWLHGRAALLKERYPAAFSDLAARWPVGVPTLRQGGHSDEQLTAIGDLLTAVEAQHQVEFGDPDPERRRPAPQIIDTLLARHDNLPADLAALVEKRGSDAQVPAVRSRKFMVAHVDVLEEILGEVEAMAAARAEIVREHVAELTDGDEQMVAALSACCSATFARCTAVEVDVLAAVHAAFTDLRLGYGETDGALTVVALDGEKQLVDRFGSKAAALAACKEIAEAHGLAKPRSVADAAGTPALVALAASAHVNSDSANQGEAA